MRLHIYHCLSQLNCLLPAKNTVADTIIILKERLIPEDLVTYRLELVISDPVKIITSQVTSNCRFVGFHLLIHHCSLRCRELRFEVGWPDEAQDLRLMEKLEPDCTLRIKKVLLLPHISETGYPVSQEEGWNLLNSQSQLLRGYDPETR